MSVTANQSPWQVEVNDLLRGMAGAFLFGTPFLYTSEVWWKGNFATPSQMFFALALTYTGLILLNWAAGFRDLRPGTRTRILTDSAESLAIGLLAATLGLVLLNIITFDSGLNAIVGRIVLEGIPFGLGVGLANTYLKGGGGEVESDGKDDRKKKEQQDEDSRKGMWSDVAATVLGATLGAMIVSAPLAPTNEVSALAGRQSYLRLLVIMSVSLLLSYFIVFVAHFIARRARLREEGLLQRPISETIFAYLISLVMAAVMLWLFNVLEFGDSLDKWVSFCIVLGFPAAIGGATGRLVL